MRASTDALLAERGLTRDPSRVRQFSEMALVVASGCALVFTLVVWGLLGWFVSFMDSASGSRVIYVVGTGAIAFLLAGLALHGLRYYLAVIGGARHRDSTPTATSDRQPIWLTRSSDWDFLIQAFVGLLVVGLVLA
jgi:hypothetical protein